MFTGLVETMGSVVAVRPDPPGVRLVIDAGSVGDGVQLGDSIAVNGCCLTVVEIEGAQLSFDAGSETLSRTNLGRLDNGSPVNLERSLRIGDRLGGHYVSGHIDAVGELHERQDDEDWSTFWFQVPRVVSKHLVGKGSIAVDGVSLTVVSVTEDRFSVALIPHTLEVTTLGRLTVGDPVNLETDLLAKYVERLLENRQHDDGQHEQDCDDHPA